MIADAFAQILTLFIHHLDLHSKRHQYPQAGHQHGYLVVFKYYQGNCNISFSFSPIVIHLSTQACTLLIS